MNYKEFFEMSVLVNPGIYTFLNPHSYLIMQENKKLYSSFDGIYLDGMATVKCLSLLHGRKFNRVSFDYSSIANDVFNFIEKNSKKIAFIGGTEQEIQSFISYMEKTRPLLDIVHYWDGYFTSIHEEEVAFAALKHSSVDFVICGMGAPYQELFLKKLKHSGWKGVGFTCGGFFKQTGSKLGDYYPAIIDKLNLRFLYRMYDEPKLIKRYMKFYPNFFIFILKKIIFK
jgi:exopolysaccharide biosynthesis WecB/TagA/CpsF family protein